MIKKSFFIALSLLMIGANSCKKDFPSNSQNVNGSTVENNYTNKSGSNLHYVGSVHNKVLDDLVDNRAWYTMTSSERVEFARDATTQELLALQEDTTNLPNANLEVYFNHAESYENHEFQYSDAVRDFLSDSVSFSSTAIGYYDDIMDVIADGENDGVEAVKQKLVNISDLADGDKSLSSSEKNMIIGAASVGYSSSAYWDDYSDEIEQGLGDWWKKAIADVSGFGAGFVGSLVYNNNNPWGHTVNPFGAGAAVGGMASKLAETDGD